MEKIRKRITFYGRVQGVGFRYHARFAADRYGLTGWVKNEYDGSVTMEVQGDEAAIDMLIGDLCGDRYIIVEEFNSKTIPVDPEERRFLVTG